MEDNKVGIAPFESVINLANAVREADKKAMEDGVRNAGDIGTYIQYTFPQILDSISKFNQFDESWNDLDFDEITVDLATQIEEKLTDDQSNLMLIVGGMLIARGAHLKLFTKKDEEVADVEAV